MRLVLTIEAPVNEFDGEWIRQHRAVDMTLMHFAKTPEDALYGEYRILKRDFDAALDKIRKAGPEGKLP